MARATTDRKRAGTAGGAVDAGDGTSDIRAGAGDVLAPDGVADRSGDDSGSAGVGMPDLPAPAPVAAPALGPGDDDPKSPARGVSEPARPPLGPGELDGPDPHEGFVFLTPPPPGPGSVAVGPRQLVRAPKK